MPSQPKVSIVVPIYNAEKYLHQTLDSLAEQTLKDIEILCVNDCSTDSSGQIIAKFAVGDPRFRQIDLPENRGEGLARKAGILASTGTYIMFLDSDDYFRHDACKIAYRKISAENTDIVQFGAEVIASPNVTVGELNGLYGFLEPYNGTLRYTSAGELIRACLERQNFGYTIWNKIYNGDIVRKAVTLFANERFNIAADVYLFYLIAMFSNSYSSVSDKLYFYRFGAGITGGKEIDDRIIENRIRQGRIHQLLTKFSEEYDPSGITDRSLDKLEQRFITDVISGWESMHSRPNMKKQFSLALECFDEKRFLGYIMQFYNSGDYRRKVSMIRDWKESGTLEAEPHPVKTVATFYQRMYNGGVERVISKLIPIWLKLGMRVILFTDELERPADYEYPNEVIRIVLPLLSDRTPENYTRRISFLQNMLKRYNVDTVVYHAWVGQSLESDILAVKRLHIPFIVYTHSFFSYGLKVDYTPAAIQSILIQKLYCLTDAVVALTETDYSWWSIVHPRVYKTLNPLTFDLSECAGAIETDRPLDILWLGRISPEKRPLDAIRILDKLVSSGVSAKLHIVGKSEIKAFEDELKAEIEKRDLTDYVELHGYRQDVLSFYQRSTVFLLTSEFEGFTMTLAESLACGTPAVVYDLPNIDLIRSNAGVKVVAQNDVSAAAKAIAEILTNPAEWEKMSRAARRSIEDMYSFDVPQLWKTVFDDVGALREKPADIRPDALRNAIFMMNDFAAEGIETREQKVQYTVPAVPRWEYKDELLKMYQSGEVGFRYIIRYAVAWLKFKLTGRARKKSNQA